MCVDIDVYCIHTDTCTGPYPHIHAPTHPYPDIPLLETVTNILGCLTNGQVFLYIATLPLALFQLDTKSKILCVCVYVDNVCASGV